MAEQKLEKKLIIFSFTKAGSEWNGRLRKWLFDSNLECQCFALSRYAEQFDIEPMPENVGQWIGSHWGSVDFLFIGAAGIAIRYIAPWIVDKYTDSAVLSMDEKGEYIIPLLSGHVGGAIEWANWIADRTKATPVISTATDVQHKFAVDVFAKKNQLHITNRELAKKISAAILDEKQIGFYSEFPIEGCVPNQLQICAEKKSLQAFELGIYVAEQESAKMEAGKTVLTLFPEHDGQTLVVGIGCRRGVQVEALEEKLCGVLQEHGRKMEQIRLFASIDLKQNESGILELSKKYKIPFLTYSAEVLEQAEIEGNGSAFVKQVTGVDNVCERAARIASPAGRCLQTKVKKEGVTFAILEEKKAIHFSGIALG